MFRLSEFTKNIRIEAVLPRHLLALLLALAAHATLVFFCVMKFGGGMEVASAPGLSQYAFAVSLVEAKSSTKKSDLPGPEQTKPGNATPGNATPGNATPGNATPNPLASSTRENNSHIISRFGILAKDTPYYFHPDELTEKPFVRRDVAPILSIGLSDAAYQSAVMRLLINEYGEVDQVEIEGDHLSLAIQQLVRDAFAHAKFEPGKIDRIPVKSQLKIEINLEVIDSP